MDSRESLAPLAPPPPSLQHQLHHHHHHQQPPPGMMMSPNSYSTHHHLTNNNVNANLINPNSMQQRFQFNAPDQFGDGSSPSGGFTSGGYSIEPPRKKRGRPRKYSPSPDGNIALGLSPAPVTAIPNAAATGNLESSNDGSAGATPNTDSSAKKHRGRPAGSGKKQLDALGAAGVGFTPHVIIIKAGEDIASTLMSFSQQGPRTVCILSANGSICNVTLRQPTSTGGTVTYEGRFEIISLSGSFLHSESERKPSGLSVSLAGSDGRVLGGGVAGMLVAASPVQVIVGSFIADGKKSKGSTIAQSSTVTPPNMLTFGGGGGGGGVAVTGVSPPSEGGSSESSDESGSSPMHTIPGGSYNNITQHHQQQPQQQQQQPQQQPQQPMQNLAMYSNMGWPNSTMNMLPN